MKDESEKWSEGQLVRAGLFESAKETDCSAWEADNAPSDWSQGRFESATINVPTTGASFFQALPTGIENDEALAATRARISQVLDQLTQLRTSGRVEEFVRVSRGYRAEVERLQGQVLDYLTQHPTSAG
jgi:hypothetical protein